jgi:signal recognition particle subunit SRP54
MFDNLSDRLSQAARNLSGKGRLSESNIKDTLRQVRLALLEADVALPVVKSFIETIPCRWISGRSRRLLSSLRDCKARARRQPPQNLRDDSSRKKRNA